MPSSLRRTRIVATVGPASSEPTKLRELLAAGVDVVRLNASHASADYLRSIVPVIREAAGSLHKHVGILLDLRGPKIRVGRLDPETGLDLVAGQRLVIARGDFAGSAERIACTYDALSRDVEVGDTLLLDDGLISVTVTKTAPPDQIEVEVVEGGLLKPNKGINVPGRALSTAAYDEKDLRDLQHGIELGVDYVALSFVRRGEDVQDLRREMHARGGVIPIIAKIEKPQALDALDGILDASDAIMVARGDLGVEIPPERVPGVQKHLISRASSRGLPVITATQMLESMIENPRPTRAEASDVANAIFDGTDAVMLSGETAAGRYPVEAVRMMARIAMQAESSEFYGRSRPEDVLAGLDPERRAVARTAQRLAEEIDADSVVIYTLTGATALAMSKLRLHRPVYALCPDASVCRRMTLLHGIFPHQLDYYDSTDDMLAEGDRLLLETGLTQAGDRVVVVGGTKQFAGVSNMIQVRHLGGAVG